MRMTERLKDPHFPGFVPLIDLTQYVFKGGTFVTSVRLVEVNYSDLLFAQGFLALFERGAQALWRIEAGMERKHPVTREL